MLKYFVDKLYAEHSDVLPRLEACGHVALTLTLSPRGKASGYVSMVASSEMSYR